MINLPQLPKLAAMMLLAFTGLAALGNNLPQNSAPNGGIKLVQVEGNVLVNGTSANSGATVLSDSTVKTGAKSSAVVSLGKLGRVEVLPDSMMKLTFTDTSASVAMLSAGRVRVSSGSGVSVTTQDGQISGGSTKSEYTVDTSCGNTFVSVSKGRVELRAGSTVKQIAAGNQDSAGTAKPGCTPRR